MPTSARGNSRRGGFTLIEMLVVVAIVAIGAALVSLAIRNPADTQLELEAARLAALLENARVEARTAGLAAWWAPGVDRQGDKDSEPFRFVGFPDGVPMPTRWLDARVAAEVVGSARLVLGPDAILPPQRVRLRLDDRSIDVGSDGLAPFAAIPAAAAAP